MAIGENDGGGGIDDSIMRNAYAIALHKVISIMVIRSFNDLT